jgi:histidinol-phosphate aminotransferase
MRSLFQKHFRDVVFYNLWTIIRSSGCSLRDYLHNLNPYLRDEEPDEAGPDPRFVASKYKIPLEKIIVLSRNENPYRPSQKVFDALNGIELNRYPNSDELIGALSIIYTRCPADNIVVGAGLDEIITTISRLLN